MAEPVLKVENLYCERDERVLFQVGLSFGIGAGDLLQPGSRQAQCDHFVFAPIRGLRFG